MVSVVKVSSGRLGWLLERLTGRQLTSVYVLAMGCRGYRAGRRWCGLRRGSIVWGLLAGLQETDRLKSKL